MENLEVWMRGPIEGVPALLQPVAHALLQVDEDILKYTKPLSSAYRGRQIPIRIRLFREPVTELQKLRKEKLSISRKKISSNDSSLFQQFNAEIAELDLVIDPQQAKNIQINVRGLAINYNVSTEELLVDNVRAIVPLRNKKLVFKLFVDRTGLELFAQNGEVYMPINYNFDRNNITYELLAFNGEAVLESADLYTLDSIWLK